MPGLINPYAFGLTISFVASATSTSTTITIPASSQEGDFAILFDFVGRSFNAAVAVIPTGWTEITDARSSQPYFDPGTALSRASYKILASGDPGASVSGSTTQDFTDKVMLVFRGSKVFTAVTPVDWTAEGTSGNPASQTVNASTSGTAPLIVFGVAAIEGGTAAFSTESPALDATVANSDTDMRAGYKIYNSSPSDHSIDMNDLGSANCLISGLVGLAA